MRATSFLQFSTVGVSDKSLFRVTVGSGTLSAPVTLCCCQQKERSSASAPHQRLMVWQAHRIPSQIVCFAFARLTAATKFAPLSARRRAGHQLATAAAAAARARVPVVQVMTHSWPHCAWMSLRRLSRNTAVLLWSTSASASSTLCSVQSGVM